MSDKDNSRDLKKLAKALYNLASREVWLGGMGSTRWPKNVGDVSWSWGATWTLSPEVELGGHQMRVCVSHTAGADTHRVRVFVDGELKYPGGKYEITSAFWKTNWSWKLALQEARDGGKDGPVDKRDLLLVEAKQKRKGVLTQHKTPLYCDMCFEAITEVENEFPEGSDDPAGE